MPADGTDALSCSDLDDLNEGIEQRCRLEFEDDTALFLFKRDCTSLWVDGHDGPQAFAAGQGAGMGDGQAHENSCENYVRKSIRPWRWAVALLQSGAFARCPQADGLHDLGISDYVDDLSWFISGATVANGTIPENVHTAAELADEQKKDNATLDACPRQGAYAQSRSKHGPTPCIRSQLENRAFSLRTDLGRIEPDIKHLCGMFNPRGSNVTERVMRLAAQNKGWAAHTRLLVHFGAASTQTPATHQQGGGADGCGKGALRHNPNHRTFPQRAADKNLRAITLAGAASEEARSIVPRRNHLCLLCGKDVPDTVNQCGSSTFSSPSATLAGINLARFF